MKKQFVHPKIWTHIVLF